jgi:tRNA dimethylallyltransferase
MPNVHPLIFCLMGPTASGKTALACELVHAFPFEIISVDSAMIYKHMNIGTAKLTAEEFLKAPHHLIDKIDPDQSYSVAEFCQDASDLMKAIHQRGKIPLLVGGSMMYFKALQQGLSSLPPADARLRTQLEAQAQEVGWDVLHQRLNEIDPQTAARIHRHDGQRIQRALEVFYLTGISLSDFIAQAKTKSSFQFVNFILFPHDRAWLHQRIAQRFVQMLENGLIEEVRQLQTRWNLNTTHPSMRCVGYHQVLDYLQGTIAESSLVEKGIAATRQLAKRQLTWLRHWENGFYYDPQNQTFMTDMMAKIKEILDNYSPLACKLR